MADYKGPERRAQITFTREDSDRLVRLEQQTLTNAEKMDTILDHIVETNEQVKNNSARITKLELYKSWVTGISATVMFLVTVVLGAIGIHLKSHE
jgi:hypothetical protein